MSESLRNDGRVWVPKKKGDTRKPADQIPEAERDYYLERKYPSFGNLSPRDIASRAAKERATRAAASAPAAAASISTSATPSSAIGEDTIREKYGNLFDMYERSRARTRTRSPMRIYPAVHYTMGGLWVDYNLQSTIPGLFVPRRGELLRSRREPPRRARADAGPRRRLLRHPLHDRQLPRRRAAPASLAEANGAAFKPAEADVEARLDKLLAIKGKRTVDSFHRELGKHHVGELRHGPQRGGRSRRRSTRSRSCARSSGRDVKRARRAATR